MAWIMIKIRFFATLIFAFSIKIWPFFYIMFQVNKLIKYIIFNAHEFMILKKKQT